MCAYLCLAVATGQSFNFTASVAFAEINEEISMTCVKHNDSNLSVYIPEENKGCSSISQQCTQIGGCSPTTICTCCVQPINSSCNATIGHLSFTVRMSSITFFGSWNCKSFSNSKCASLLIQQYGKYNIYLDRIAS